MIGGLHNAGVAKHGQRRKIQSLVLQRSASSNLVPCIFYLFIFIYVLEVKENTYLYQSILFIILLHFLYKGP
jgi:hypothetical protein